MNKLCFYNSRSIKIKSRSREIGVTPSTSIRMAPCGLKTLLYSSVWLVTSLHFLPISFDNPPFILVYYPLCFLCFLHCSAVSILHPLVHLSTQTLMFSYGILVSQYRSLHLLLPLCLLLLSQVFKLLFSFDLLLCTVIDSLDYTLCGHNLKFSDVVVSICCQITFL